MKGSLLVRYFASIHNRYCILGGGTGGINITAHLLRSGIHPNEIRIIQPSAVHSYQPGWTMVGAGLWNIMPTTKKMENVIPAGVNHSNKTVKSVRPNLNTVICEDGSEFTYNELIVATGLRLQYEKIEGLKEALDNPQSKVGSIYELKYAQKVAILSEQFAGGKAIFTEPALPIKCAGAPQKILYLCTDKWTTKNIKTSIQFFKTGAVMFSVPKYAQSLIKTASDYGIQSHFKHPLIKIQSNRAIFQNQQTKQKIIKTFDFLHVVPPMGPHSFIAESELADATGYLDVHKETLRHNKYKNIWGIGDCTNLPCSKTAAAVFSQTEALLNNLIAVRKNPTETNLPGRYEGYSSCPLFVGKLKLMLAEFKYDGVVDETFYKDQERPRVEFYFLKRFVFPLAYWFLVPAGRWFGRKGIRWI